MFRDGALEVHLALLQPQFWKRHSKRRKELDVSVATDIACGSIFHIKTYPPRSASDQGHQATLVWPTLGLSEHISLCRYAPYEIVVTPRCKAHDPQHI